MRRETYDRGLAKRAWAFAALALLLFHPHDDCKAQGFEADENRSGMDIREFDLPRPEPLLCYQACVNDQNCNAYTYRSPDKASGHQAARCSLKSGVPAANFDPNAISGTVLRTTRRVIAGVPYVASVSPDAGPAWGSVPVTIRGSGFVKVVRVIFGGQEEAESFEVVSESEIRAVPPPYPNPMAIPAGGFLVDVAPCSRVGCGQPHVGATFLYRTPEGLRIVGDTEFVGMDIRNFDVKYEGQCYSACVRDTACKAFSYKVELHALGGGPGPQPTPHPAHCWLKSGVPSQTREDKLYFSGVVERK